MDKVAVVTGCSSGIGYETALALAREGYFTYATMRDASRGDKILDAAREENLNISVVELDVDSASSIDSAMDRIVSEKDRVDVLVNNAGYVIFGTVEDLTVKEFREQFETNFFGVIRMIQKAAPVMRRNGGGHIVNVSSVAGRIGFRALLRISAQSSLWRGSARACGTSWTAWHKGDNNRARGDQDQLL